MINRFNKNFEKNYELDDKVDNYIEWYYKHQNEIYKSKEYSYRETKRMRNFIERMAVWYEFKYPNNEINNALFDKNYNNPNLFDTHTFITLLPKNEKQYFNKPCYKKLVYFKYPNLAHMYLTKKGLVKDVDGIKSNYKNFYGKHIKEVVSFLKKNKIDSSKYIELENAIKDYENQKYQKEEMLNCIMYRIIERDYEYGAKRAFLFAKEFNRNIDIPLKYGISYLNSDLRLFINEYIKAGGSKDLICLIDFAARSKKNQKLKTETIQKLLENIWHRYDSKYTPEEINLQQRLINVLVKEKNIKEENVKKLTLKKN